MNDSGKIRLAGAKFGVYNECGEKVCEGVTDCNGELCFGHLPLGEYCVRELCAPDGFLPSHEEFWVKITPCDREKTLCVFNRRVRGEIKIIKYGEDIGCCNDGKDDCKDDCKGDRCNCCDCCDCCKCRCNKNRCGICGLFC